MNIMSKVTIMTLITELDSVLSRALRITCRPWTKETAFSVRKALSDLMAFVSSAIQTELRTITIIINIAKQRLSSNVLKFSLKYNKTSLDLFEASLNSFLWPRRLHLFTRVF
ncbi:hypothetical protein BpHYR1_025520 [Brachionus plicatilis]|uniref:Uncharacterized protein n=1 Tax=Brachionus plicatilis TaxID=10195 RepID=A0A3M7RBN7_BRAPC|nr:hypothetical protein BpHYR1_025520 [Brachionus plicatilis]